MPNRWGGRWWTRLLPKSRRTPGSSFRGIPRCRSSRRSATARRELDVIASEAKQSMEDKRAEAGLLRRYAPRNDDYGRITGLRMPLQNRVTPTGDIIATPHRGLFTGNRGIIHDPATKTLLTRRWASQAWLTCVCEFRGRRREVMGGRSWTELFFLDEATALAAGHRPC